MSRRNMTRGATQILQALSCPEYMLQEALQKKLEWVERARSATTEDELKTIFHNAPHLSLAYKIAAKKLGTMHQHWLTSKGTVSMYKGNLIRENWNLGTKGNFLLRQKLEKLGRSKLKKAKTLHAFWWAYIFLPNDSEVRLEVIEKYDERFLKLITPAATEKKLNEYISPWYIPESKTYEAACRQLQKIMRKRIENAKTFLECQSIWNQIEFKLPANLNLRHQLLRKIAYMP